MRCSLIYSEPAPGWSVQGEADLSSTLAISGNGWSVRRFSTFATACRYTWERWALSVLGEAVWSYDDDGDPVVLFDGYHIHGFRAEVVGVLCSRDDRSADDPVVALAACALDQDKIRGRL